MRPPYSITPEIIRSIADISRKIGVVDARFLVRRDPKLRKRNRIRTIQATLRIEGNALTTEQVTAIVEQKRVVGPEKEIREVLNALEVYRQLDGFRYHSEKDFLRAHKVLMSGLIESPGKYRTKGVGIAKGPAVQHIAPPADRVRFLMKELFTYLKNADELALVKSCVFHYEMEFIHPFLDGNGRMGRLWQTVILANAYPVFAYLPFETWIAENQSGYFQALAKSDKSGHSTAFIEFMLRIIDRSLDTLLDERPAKPDADDRLAIFLEKCSKPFTRKDYMRHFPELSSATASRDLKRGVDQKHIRKKGDKKTTVYTLQ